MIAAAVFKTVSYGNGVAKDRRRARGLRRAFAIWMAAALSLACHSPAGRPDRDPVDGSARDSSAVPWIALLCAASGTIDDLCIVVACRQRAVPAWRSGSWTPDGRGGALVLLYQGAAIGAVLAFTAGRFSRGSLVGDGAQDELPPRGRGGVFWQGGERSTLPAPELGAFVITASTTSLAMFGLATSIAKFRSSRPWLLLVANAFPT